MSAKKPNLFTVAKEIRMEGEAWKDAVSRASVQLFGHPAKAAKPRVQKKFSGKTKSECFGLEQDGCDVPCGWVKESKVNKKTGKTAKAHCAMKRAGAKKLKAGDALPF